MKNLLQILSIFILLSSCSKDNSFESAATPTLPSNTYSYHANDDEATLGRVLFYDRNLSINKSISCASCHKQQFAFADNKAFSTGVNITPTLRNSIALSNLNMNDNLFWDSRESNLNDLVFTPITDHIEMGIQDVDALVSHISNVPYYQELFEKAYNSPAVSQEGISIALAAFMNSLRSNNSKFDLGKQINHSNFSAREIMGKELFFGKAQCSQCHTGNDFGGNMNANIGLDLVYADQGVGSNSNNEFDNGEFKTPSLRNVELTAPYMHDGRFETLEEVVNHYNSGIQQHPNLNWRLTVDAFLNQTGPQGWWIEPENGGSVINLDLSENEQDALVAFLKTLTDNEYCTDARYSDPFRR